MIQCHLLWRNLYSNSFRKYFLIPSRITLKAWTWWNVEGLILHNKHDLFAYCLRTTMYIVSHLHCSWSAVTYYIFVLYVNQHIFCEDVEWEEICFVWHEIFKICARDVLGSNSSSCLMRLPSNPRGFISNIGTIAGVEKKSGLASGNGCRNNQPVMK